jgi:hypothetical protein
MHKLTKLQFRAWQFEGPQKMQNTGKTEHFHTYIKENYIGKAKNI